MFDSIVISPPRVVYPYKVTIFCYRKEGFDSVEDIVKETIGAYGGSFVVESCYGGTMIVCQFNRLENSQWFYKTIMLDFI
jgi:hypothetical protein